MKNLAAMREDYRLQSLDIKDVADDPIQQFQSWMNAAIESQILEPNAMTLATASADGVPSARVVLLKNIENGGFVFYTNYKSQKAKELEDNPRAALVFNWLDLQRQVRIQGKVSQQDKAASQAYFQSRPRGSQIGAYASPQSQVIEDRSVIEQRAEKIAQAYADVETLPLPDFWGGYVVHPEQIEFWQGRSSRMHDRIRYTKQGEKWIRARLAP